MRTSCQHREFNNEKLRKDGKLSMVGSRSITYETLKTWRVTVTKETVTTKHRGNKINSVYVVAA